MHHFQAQIQEFSSGEVQLSENFDKQKKKKTKTKKKKKKKGRRTENAEVYM